MRIIIEGGGKIGSTLTKLLLDEGHEVTLVDKSSDILENIMEKYDVMGFKGNAAAAATLVNADVDDSDLLIAVTDADEVNLLACMTAHGINPNIHTIARIRNPEYLYQAYQMRNIFGINMVINPEQQTAEEIANSLKYPGFLKVESFAKGRVKIIELKVRENTTFKDTTLKDLHKVVKCQVLVCGVLRDGKLIMPDGNFIIKENDKIYVTASSANLNTLLHNIGAIIKPIKHVMITGGSKISYYLALELNKIKVHTTIVEQNHETCELLANLLPDSTIIEGDASNSAFLEAERLPDYDAMVNLTGLDELNIIMSTYGEISGIKQIITKLSHAENYKLLDKLNIGSIISPKELASNNIVRYVRAMNNQKGAAISIHNIANGQIEAIEFRVDKETKNINKPLKDIKFKKGVLIAGIDTGFKSEIPSGLSKFDIGNTIVIITNKDRQLLSINDIFEGSDN